MEPKPSEILTRISAFYQAARDLTKEADHIVERSGAKLGLGIDPFALDLLEHRQLQNLNENAYSDWLAWVLKISCRNPASGLALCRCLFDGEQAAEMASNTEVPSRWKIEREPGVAQGHEGQTGRLDLLIDFHKTRTWHVEVKVCDAEFAAKTGQFEKHKGYAQSLKDYPNCKHILLVTDCAKTTYPVDAEGDPNGPEFTAIRWGTLCLRLRSWVAESGAPQLEAAMLLLFCGIVEQQLLGMRRNSLLQMAYVTRTLEDSECRRPMRSIERV